MRGEPIHTAVARVIDILESQKALHQTLLETSAQKEKAILDGQVKTLENVVKEEQNLLFRVQDLERQRRLCMEELGIAGGTVSDVIERADSAQQAALEAVRTELVEIYEAQQRRNERNRQLIESKLEYINFMVDAVSFSHNPSQTYGATGRDAAEASKRKLNLYDKQV